MPNEKRDHELEAFIPLKLDLFHILLALDHHELHGYGIMKAVEESTDGGIVLEPSPLYRRLKRLVEAGIVAESGRRPAAELDDERRRYYRLTPRGRRLLASESARLVALAETRRVRELAALGQSGR